MENLYEEEMRARLKEDRIRILESNMLDEVRKQNIYNKIKQNITLPFQNGKREAYFPFPAMKVNEKIKVDVVNHIYEQMIKKISEAFYEAAKDFYEAVEDSDCDKVLRFEDKEIKFY